MSSFSAILTMAAMLVIAAIPGRLAAQDTAAAKADGKAFGNALTPSAQSAATTAPDASRVPNFTASPQQSSYFDNPASLTGDAAATASSNEAWRSVKSSIDTRARFDVSTISDSTQRAKAIATDPTRYTSGMDASGGQGRCVPLPPATTSPGRYTATCNSGMKLAADAESCAIPLVATAKTVTDYLYYCTDGAIQGQQDCALLPDGLCTRTGSHPGKCLQGFRDSSGVFHCTEPGEPVVEETCSARVAGFTPVSVTTRNVISTAREESACTSLSGDSACSNSQEICTDSDPVMRSINGIAVTAPCWAWRRDYQCNRTSAAQDCGTLDATPGCQFVREDCISDASPCLTYERVYDCPLPPDPAMQQFICDGDVYCLNGNCETITREPNTEFKDAAVALNAMDQAKREFDPNTLSLFKGERNTCSSQVFGIINCCQGKGFPLIPGIGLLVSLACSSEEILLHQRDSAGLCAYVGTYCSTSFLGICLTKQKVYCCFQSKLSRILQDQGRKQLPKPWAKPKSEQCLGFTLTEFARLDLSKMDFSEVYAEFTGAAKLPDELATATEMQQKIEDYYAAHGH